MSAVAENNMGRVWADVMVENAADTFIAESTGSPQAAIRRVEAHCLVDTGATMLCLPMAAIEKLGLRLIATKPVITANNETSSPLADLGVGIYLVGLCFVFFFAGLAFDSSSPDMPSGALVLTIGLSLWLGGMTAAGIARAAKRPWAGPLMTKLLNAAGAGLQALTLGWVIHAATEGRARPLAYYAVAAWIVLSLVIFAFEKRAPKSKPRYLYSVVEPLGLLYTAPGPTLGIAFFFGSMILAGEWLGAQVGYPHLGAALGLVFLPSLARRAIRWTAPRRHAQADQPPQSP